jgi:hypothetical protein
MMSRPQNRKGAGPEKTPPTGRRKNGTFEAGTSGNPGGRPKSLRNLILEECEGGDGREVVEFMFSVMRGTLRVKRRAAKTGKPYNDTPPFKERRMAAEWIGDQLFGRARQSVDVRDAGKSEAAQRMSLLTDDELKTVETLLEQAAAREGPEQG